MLHPPPHGDTPERKAKRKEVSDKLGDQIIELLNEALIRPHDMDSGDAIYVASTVLGECAAIIMFDQLPEEAWGSVEVLKEAFVKMFGDRVDAIMELRRIAGEGMSSSDAADKLIREGGVPPSLEGQFKAKPDGKSFWD